MPADTAELMHHRWSLVHDDSFIEFHRLRDVFVVAEGLIFDREGRLFSASIGQHTAAVVDWATELVKITIADGSPKTIKGTVLLCGRPGLSNYGHWLAEILPIVFLARGFDLSVFIPQIYPWMEGVISDSLDLLKIPANSRLTGNGYVIPQHCEEIIFVHGISAHGLYYSDVAIACADELMAAIRPGTADRLWMSRVGQRRCLLNEGGVIPALEEHGWTVVEAQNMDLREQIALAKGATHMAGVQGAALTNLLFMRAGGKVTSLVPACMPDNFYWTLSQHKQLNFSEIRCPHDAPVAWHIPWDSELAVSQADLLAIISR